MSTPKMMLLLPAALMLLACGGNAEMEPLGTNKSPILSTPAPMLGKRSDAMATVLKDGRILITGGRDATAYIKTTEIYNPATNTWTSAAATSAEHTGGVAVTLKDGRVLLIGGPLTSGTYLAELFDGTTWKAVGGTTMPRLSFVQAFVLSDGSVAVFGADFTDSASTGYQTKTYLYTPNSGIGTWMTGKSPTYTHNFGAHAQLADDSILLAGGQNPAGSISNAERYVPSTNTWINAGTVKKRSQALAVSVPGGALVIGGVSLSTPVTDVEAYNTATNTWTTMTPSLGLHYHTAAVLLPSGTVYVPGGGDASAELYDPKTDRWVSAESLPTVLSRHSTVLVGSDVYLLGGQTTATTYSEPIATVMKYRQPQLGEACTYTIECAVGTCSGGVCTSTGPTDTGTPPTDTGTPPADTGTPSTTDSGVSPTDTGSVVTDTGTLPADTGTVVADTGTTTTDTGFMDTGSSATDSGNSTSEDAGSDSGQATQDTGPNCEDYDALSEGDFRNCYGDPLTFDAKACQAAPGSTGAGSVLGGLVAVLAVLLRRRNGR